MDNASILFSGFLTEVRRAVVEHLGVSVVTALILLLIGIFKKRLINLSALFVSVRVHGKWATTLNEPAAGETPAHEYVTLNQFFNKVWGEAVVQNPSRDVYQVRGQVIGEKLSMIFRDKKGFDSGAILLKVMAKRLMKGYEVGVDSDGNIYSEVYIWRRRDD